MGNKKKQTKGKPPAAKQPQSGSLKTILIAAAIIVFLGAGAGLGWALSRGGDSGSSTTASSNLKPPAFAYEAGTPKGTPQAYQVALDIPDELAQIPCYCGCGLEAGHKNNLDCFIKSRQGDKVLFDRHAAG